MLAGDDLTIVLFFVGTAVSFGCAAVSSAGWKHPALIACLFALAGVCFVFGAAWPALKEISPPSLSVPVHQIATNPVSWFAVLVLGMAASILMPKRRRSPDRSGQTEAAATRVIQPTKAEEKEKSEPEEKLVINVTAEHMIGIYKGRTTIQADALAAMYLGKWVTISGTVANVYKTRSGYRMIIFAAGDYDKLVTFDFGENAHVAYFTRDSQITVHGRIERIGSMGIDMEQCELVP